MQATLGTRLDADTSRLIAQRLDAFARRHRLTVPPLADMPAARAWGEVVAAIPPDSRLYQSALRLLNRAITGKPSTYWQSLWHDGAHPNRPQPMRYL